MNDWKDKPEADLQPNPAPKEAVNAENGTSPAKEEVSGRMVYLPVDRLHPHPDNPRKELGDLTELADSIKANGIYQNLTVVPLSDVDPDATIDMGDDHYTVIIGHRRLAAAKLAGLTEVPCVVTTMTDKEQVQTMLLENTIALQHNANRLMSVILFLFQM